MLLQDNHPIFEACKSGDYDTVAGYLAEGVSVYAENEHNPAIFGIVANRGHKRILELMIQYGLDIARSHNRFGESVAGFAIRIDSVEWLEYFLDLGIPADYADSTGHSFVEFAAGGGKMNCLSFPINRGTKIETRNQQNTTLFREATRNNQIVATFDAG
jgi:hypothetical protein